MGQKSLSRDQRLLCGASEDPTKFKFSKDGRVIKRARECEVDVYECLFNTHLFPESQVDASWRAYYQNLRRFAPQYYGATLVDEKEKRYSLVLENLLAGYATRPSYLDLKMGTDCVLKQPGSPEYEDFARIDTSTTTREHGYRVTGYCLCRDNKVIEH